MSTSSLGTSRVRAPSEARQTAERRGCDLESCAGSAGKSTDGRGKRVAWHELLGREARKRLCENNGFDKGATPGLGRPQRHRSGFHQKGVNSHVSIYSATRKASQTANYREALPGSPGHARSVRAVHRGQPRLHHRPGAGSGFQERQRFPAVARAAIPHCTRRQSGGQQQKAKGSSFTSIRGTEEKTRHQRNCFPEGGLQRVPGRLLKMGL